MRAAKQKQAAMALLERVSRPNQPTHHQHLHLIVFIVMLSIIVYIIILIFIILIILTLTIIVRTREWQQWVLCIKLCLA